MKKYVVILIVITSAHLSMAQSAGAIREPLGIALENFSYPFPVQYLHFTLQGQNVSMAYMDVGPVSQPNGKTILLLHGKNFFGAYWDKTIRYLTSKGYRVIVPDQLGFGKSSKPALYYSFQMMADLTRKLLDTLAVSNVSIVGHSMGGMLATRFTLMFPDYVARLVLENPIGLEDYKIKVPYATVENEYLKELRKSEAGIRQYHKSYYVNWKEEYETYVQVHYRWTLGGEYNRLAMANALTRQMVYTQPVVYEFQHIKTPTLLVIGQSDRTAIGKDAVPEAVKKTMGLYPDLGKATAKAIPGAQLIELENIGHIPHLEATDKFNMALENFLHTDHKQ